MAAGEHVELFAPAGGPFMSFPCDLGQLHDEESGAELVPDGVPGWISRMAREADAARRPSGRRIAVVDSGVLPGHSWIKASLEPGSVTDFTGEGWEDTNGHGTMTALLTLTASSEPITLLSAKIVGRDGRAEPENLVRALQWCADRHVNAVVLSAGVYRRRWGRDVMCDGNCRVCEAASAVLDGGVGISAAGGNRVGLLACPATLARVGHANIIAVGPMDAEGRGYVHVAGITVPYASHGTPVVLGKPPSPTMVRAYELEAQNSQDAVDAYLVVVDQEDADEAAHALCRLGELHERAGDALAAINAYRQAVARDHRHASPLAGIRLGNVLEAIGDHGAAVAAFEQVAATSHRVYAPMALLNVGNGEWRAGEMVAAEAAFRAAGSFVNSAGGGAALKNLGVLLWQTERFEEASRAFRTVLEWGPHPERPGVALNLGMMENQLGHLAAAKDWFEMAIAIGEDDLASRAALELGDLLAAQREVSSAQEVYEIALRRGSDVTREQAREAIGALDRPSTEARP